MSLVFNMVGGGSGGLEDGNAILSVTVPADSTVTSTKGGVTLRPSLWLSGADVSTEVALFVFTPAQFDSVNLWTITATDGTNTASTTILITTNKEYEVTLSYYVPAIYQAVEYLQNDESAYIDTGIVTGANNFVIDFTMVQSQLNSTEHPIMSTWNSNKNFWNLYAASSRINWYINVSGGKELITNATAGTLYAITLDRTGGTWTYEINGVTGTARTGETASDNVSIKLFSRGDLNRGVGGIRLYQTKVYVAGVLTGDFRPCYRKSDSVAGMWDDVSQTFFVNESSTGTFIVGPNVN